ncbi:MAG: type II CRISPR-associated endonuclease Cas1 [Rhodospirillales bacterium]|nr:type II CRISPR-associated endonuclease Cas1 [Rhodospirillales bacterium]
MAWRTVMIQNPAALSLAKGQLKLQNDDGDYTLPLEDITALILESPQITLSSSLLSASQKQGIVVITCDETHIPNGILHPFQPHSRQSKVAHMQISWTESLKKRLWQKVVQSKITNQATCLEQITGQAEARRLYALVDRVDSGDSKNVEAQAARDYWPRLMGGGFKRRQEDIFNAALNYGYAVVRAYVARAQVAYGLLPTFGLHHANELNAFNLTDDMMEVFRPFVDYQVWSLKTEERLPIDETLLPSDIRQELANIGHTNCQIEGQLHTIANACDKMAASLVNAIEGKSPALLSLPEFQKRTEA